MCSGRGLIYPPEKERMGVGMVAGALPCFPLALPSHSCAAFRDSSERALSLSLSTCCKPRRHSTHFFWYYNGFKGPCLLSDFGAVTSDWGALPGGPNLPLLQYCAETPLVLMAWPTCRQGNIMAPEPRVFYHAVCLCVKFCLLFAPVFLWRVDQKQTHTCCRSEKLLCQVTIVSATCAR